MIVIVITTVLQLISLAGREILDPFCVDVAKVPHTSHESWPENALQRTMLKVGLIRCRA